MTPDQYAQLGENVHGAIVGVIKTVVRPDAPDANKGLVLDRDPVSIDDAQWLGALQSDDDLDENGDKRAHAWIVKFGGSIDPASSAVRCIEPKWPFDVEVFYQHDFGDEVDNSEKRIRAEVLKVQKALADQTKLGGVHVALGGGENAYISRHSDLTIRMRLGRMGGHIIHRGTGVITVELQPILRG